MQSLVAKGKADARRLTLACVLLKAECISHGPAWSGQQISEVVDLGVRLEGASSQ